MSTGGHEETEGFAFTTPRLALRPRLPGDALAVNALAANPAVALNLCATIREGEGQAFVVEEGRTARIVGAASHGPTGLGSGTEVAVWIGEPYWQQGYATEAMQALVDHAFADGAAGAVWCANRVTNPRARHVIEKCGFQYRGSGMVCLPGRGAFPIERFALERVAWRSLKAWGAHPAPGLRRDAPSRISVRP
jgi:GNAT superfamily N-acetyltransferase